MGVTASNTRPEGSSPGLGKMQTYHPNGRTATSYWNAEPRVILSNDSDYIVSFWVVEEDKKRTKDQQQKIVRSIGLQLNASFNRSSNTKHNNTSNDKTTSNKSNDNSANNVGSLNKHSSSAGPPPSDDRETTQAFGETLDQTGGEEEDEVYYLMRDHRMGRKSSTQPTQVPFPADCKHMRVYAFFEDRGEWQCFKDQVYSIALINKNFRIAASTSNITPYHSKTSGTPKLLLEGRSQAHPTEFTKICDILTFAKGRVSSMQNVYVEIM